MRYPYAAMLMLVTPLAQAATCTMSATDVVFGNYRVSSDTDVQTTSTVSLDCAADMVPASVAFTISIGSGGSGDPAERAMGGALNYNLYVDASRTIVWGDGTSGSVQVAGAIPPPGTGTASYTAYGIIPAGQSPTAGSYSDLLTITIDY